MTGDKGKIDQLLATALRERLALGHQTGAKAQTRDGRRINVLAEARGVARVCLNGLESAQPSLGTKIYDWVCDELNAARREHASTHLLDSHQMRRAWKDMLAVPGWRGKVAYVAARALPSPAFVRGKFSQMSHMPLSLLYARRMVDLIRTRPKQGQG